MNDSETIKARLYRFDPQDGKGSRYEEYLVPATPVTRVLDVLRSIYENQAGDLAFQYACRIGRCGTCTVRVNGRPVLACQERATKDMTIEPLSPFPLLRDLVVDRGVAEEQFATLELTPQRNSPHPGSREAIEPAVAHAVGAMGSCISCMACVSACPAVDERRFDGPAFMLQLRKMADHPADHGARLEQAMNGGLFECFGCDACTQVCPADLSPADAIRQFRREAVFGPRKKNAFAGKGDQG